MTAGRQIISQSQEWCTPKKYVDAINYFFDNNIDLDPCSNKYSIVPAHNKIMLPNNGLILDWNFKNIYVNPPYGIDKLRKTTIKMWLKKCYESNLNYGAEVIALIPVAPNTSHWKEYIWGGADAICFLYDTRLKFMVMGQDCLKGAPMACCLIYWGARKQDFHKLFINFGAVVQLDTLKAQLIGKAQDRNCQVSYTNKKQVKINNTNIGLFDAML